MKAGKQEMRGKSALLRPVRMVGWVAVLWILTNPAWGAEAVAPFRPPHGFAQMWAKTMGLALVGTAALLIIHTLIFRRKRLDETASKWMLFMGICLLPTPVMFLSTGVGLEQSKDVEFCMKCHVMHVFGDDMKNPASKTLAALHFKNRYIQREQCYRCHTDYGILGTMAAKKEGLGHIWKEATGSYHLPIKMSKPYNYSICLDCHAESAKFNKQAIHAGVVQETLSGKSKCLDCHDAPHPPPEARSKE